MMNAAAMAEIQLFMSDILDFLLGTFKTIRLNIGGSAGIESWESVAAGPYVEGTRAPLSMSCLYLDAGHLVVDMLDQIAFKS